MADRFEWRYLGFDTNLFILSPELSATFYFSFSTYDETLVYYGGFVSCLKALIKVLKTYSSSKDNFGFINADIQRFNCNFLERIAKKFCLPNVSFNDYYFISTKRGKN